MQQQEKLSQPLIGESHVNVLSFTNTCRSAGVSECPDYLIYIIEKWQSDIATFSRYKPPHNLIEMATILAEYKVRRKTDVIIRDR
ncbi:hypothetical protein TUM12370_34250 [Salmonella enterica subsp. enterica serovar Choleraesuis]|nr:hypothetical protein TUM12370_34250 [Salmonella enterica subsp. enterica serovar Choleraesuis]